MNPSTSVWEKNLQVRVYIRVQLEIESISVNTGCMIIPFPYNTLLLTSVQTKKINTTVKFCTVSISW